VRFGPVGEASADLYLLCFQRPSFPPTRQMASAASPSRRGAAIHKEFRKMAPKLTKKEQAALARHQRKCVVCHHPDLEVIEEEYLHWRDVWKLARQYKIDDYRSIHRHARALGLVQIRRENIFTALDYIVEKSEAAKVTGDTVIRAIRAYSCINEHGQWAEPPARVVFTTERTVFPATTTKRALQAHAVQNTPAVKDVPAATDPALLANALRKMRASGEISPANCATPCPACPDAGREPSRRVAPALGLPAVAGLQQPTAKPVPTRSESESLLSTLKNASNVQIKLIYAPGIKNQANPLKT
jgi:hypothetical protein